MKSKVAPNSTTAVGRPKGNGGAGPAIKSKVAEGNTCVTDVAPAPAVERALHGRQAAEAEVNLLKFTARTPRSKFPLMAAQEAGISKTTLLRYARLSEKGKVLAHAATEANGTLKKDFVEQINRICNQYPDLYDKVLEGIRNRQYKIPEDIRSLLIKHDQHKAELAAACRERKRLEAEADRTAAEAQAEADRKLAEELENDLPDAPPEPPAPPATGSVPPAPQEKERKPQTTYPVQEVIDGTAYEGLQKRYDQDTKDFFTDMRELYAAMRKAEEIATRWGNRLQDQHLSGHQGEMLLWETYSVAWDRLGKFKKLGGSKVTSVPAFWQLIAEITQRIRQATALGVTYTTFSVKKYGPFKVAETQAEFYRGGMVKP